jgi:hypothetical protein
MEKQFAMETVQDMDKILAILKPKLEDSKIKYHFLKEEDTTEWHYKDQQEYWRVRKSVVDTYFNCLQMNEWAGDYRRFLETGLDGWTSRDLSKVGKEILNRYLNKVVEETWWDANEDRLMAEFESSRQYLGDDDRNFEWYINREYETYLQTL